MIKILIVEDDPSIRKTVFSVLSQHPYQLFEAGNVHSAREIFEQEQPDLVLVDVGLPDGNGLALVAQWRSVSHVGIVMLTGKGEMDDRVLGLSLGADYYLTKPVDSRELVVTIQALLSRMSSMGATSMSATATSERQVGQWSLDLLSWRLMNDANDQFVLTGKEFILLKMLAEAKDSYVSRYDLTLALTGKTDDNAEKAMNVLISRLRRKIRAELGVDIPLKTMRSHGYSFPGLRLLKEVANQL